MPESLYPLLLKPSLHIKVWGGRKLASHMDKNLPDDSPYGESWELHDGCIVANGSLEGRSLAELVKAYGAALIGEGCNPDEGMPLLVKLLDAADWLSVQVHPNDEQAKALEGDPRGKTEAWIILVTEPNAKLVIGIESGTSSEAMADAIRKGSLEDLLVYATVQAGDVLYMPANTVHAIGPGILLYEVQQSSDVTYRLYDWNRTGLDGKPRQLHIEKGVQVSNLDTLPDVTHPEGELLVDGEYFQTWRYQGANTVTLNTNGKFHSITCVDGQATIQGEMLNKGQTLLIPANYGEYSIGLSGIVFLSHMK